MPDEDERWDEISALAEARRKGFEEARREGREETARNLIALGEMSIEKIAQVTKVNVGKLKAMMQSQDI